MSYRRLTELPFSLFRTAFPFLLCTDPFISESLILWNYLPIVEYHFSKGLLTSPRQEPSNVMSLQILTLVLFFILPDFYYKKHNTRNDDCERLVCLSPREDRSKKNSLAQYYISAEILNGKIWTKDIFLYV